MTDSQGLLSKITALRQRLEQTRGLEEQAKEVAAAVDVSSGDDSRVQKLERSLVFGARHSRLLDDALRRLSDADPSEATMPTQLTARARRALELGRSLLARLRALAGAIANTDEQPAEKEDPALVLYRETAAMADTALRTIQAFPDSPSTQLHLAEGLEAILNVVAERLATLDEIIVQRRAEALQLNTLAELLSELNEGRQHGMQPFTTLGEEILAEAQAAGPLRFTRADPQHPARFIAGHSLTVARVAARLVRHDPELRSRPLEPVLAALVHDAGMLRVPASILAHPGRLDDEERRQIENHPRRGAEMLRRLLFNDGGLIEAVAEHHERLDGAGYPNGLRATQITSLARLLAVCDTYVALCSPRPYRPARETRTALTDTLLLAEQGMLDRQHAERLLQLSFYPVGSAVELADGSVGVVVATHLGRRDLNLPARPVVAVLTNADGQPLPAPQHLDLAQCEGHNIVRSLHPAERRELLGKRYPMWA
jgi:HD-GYP domain-containing protein (c-di-GMP phosphodiesterase class II)